MATASELTTQTNVAATNPNLDKIKQSTNAATEKSASDVAQKSLSGNFETFLKLLTTQLKNQDPTQPLDTNQFTQQLVEFSGVEQAINTNKNLEKLISLNSGGQINNAVNYIGRDVVADGDQAALSKGKATFQYDLPAGVANNVVSVVNSLGQVVYSAKGPVAAGRNSFAWDGINNFTQTKMPDGVYKIVVQPTDSKQKALEAKTYTSGKVSAVELQGGNVVLSLGSVKVPLDKVTSVTESAAAATASPATGSTTTVPKT